MACYFKNFPLAHISISQTFGVPPKSTLLTKNTLLAILNFGRVFTRISMVITSLVFGGHSTPTFASTTHRLQKEFIPPSISSSSISRHKINPFVVNIARELMFSRYLPVHESASESVKCFTTYTPQVFQAILICSLGLFKVTMINANVLQHTIKSSKLLCLYIIIQRRINYAKKIKS